MRRYYMYMTLKKCMRYELHVSLSTGTLSTRCCNGFLVMLALGPSFGDAAILCNINTCMVYIYCFGYYVSCKASTISFHDNAALSDEFLVRIHVALGPTLEMLL